MKESKRNKLARTWRKNYEISLELTFLKKRNHIKSHIHILTISGVIKTDPFEFLNEQKRNVSADIIHRNQTGYVKYRL